MASLGHIAVGLAVARVRAGRPLRERRRLGAGLLWSLLSLLPDVDVIGFSLGVKYGDEWGHRGATHSIVFSVAVAALVGAAALPRRRPAVSTALAAALVVLAGVATLAQEPTFRAGTTIVPVLATVLERENDLRLILLVFLQHALRELPLKAKDLRAGL